MKASELIKKLEKEIEDNGNDFEVVVFDNYCGENRDYTLVSTVFSEGVRLELSEEIENF